MLTIRHEQLDALRRPESAPFEQRLYVALEQGYPAEAATMGSEGLHALVDHGLRTGWRAGLETEESLSRLVVLMLQLGPDFERSPDRERALARLRHPRLPGRLKIDMIEDLLTARTGGRVVVDQAQVSS